MDIVEERIKRWKQKLIDLSKRNRLLNFRPTKVTTIRIVDEIPSEVYRLIAIDNISMGFVPVASDEKDDEGKNGANDKNTVKNIKQQMIFPNVKGTRFINMIFCFIVNILF
jgi:hypothetical protein